MRALVVLDERWNSALTDLGFKIALSLSKECEVSVAALRNFPAWKMAKGEGFPLFEISDPRKGLPLKPFLTFKESVERFNPNLVVTIRGDEMLFGALLKKKFGYKLFRIHGSARGIRNSFLNRYIHRKLVDGVIVSTKKFINSVVLNIPKLTVRGIVDTDKFSFSETGRRAFREKLGVGEKKLIGTVGRLDPVKGHRLLLKAVSKLRRNDFILAIVGEEKNVKLSELRELSKKLNISDKVIFIGKRIERISDFMSACDLAVVSSVGSEVIVRAPLEFMACQTPVVSTNVGALPEVIRLPFGVTVEPDEEKLSNAINRFLDMDLERLGKLAREVAVERYSFSSLSPVINSFLLNGM